MTSQSPTIASGMSQEKLYASAQKTWHPQPGELAQATAPQQMSGVNWQEVQESNGSKSYDLETSDVVYLSTISPALSLDHVESPTATRPVSFRDQAIGALKEKLGQLQGDTFSHNFFVAELAKAGVGILAYSLSRLGTAAEEIMSILNVARQEKIAAVTTGLEQVSGEAVLFTIVTGKRV